MPEHYDGDEDDPVKIYSSIDKAIIKFGSVLKNNKSRGMYQLLTSNPKKEYYLKEMAIIIEKNPNPRLPIYEHHIGVLVDSGIVKVRIKMHNKHKTKFYRISPVVMITSPVLYDKAIKSKTLKNTFNQVFKFAAIGISGVISWHLLPKAPEFSEDVVFTSHTLSDPNLSVIPFLVVLSGLVIERLIFLRKKRVQ